MLKLLLAPVIVPGCALLGVIAGALYFGAVIAVVDWLGGSLASSDAAASSIGSRAAIPAFALGTPAGALVGYGLSALWIAPDEDAWRHWTFTSIAAVAIAGLLAIVCWIIPLYHSFVPAMTVLMGKAGGISTIVGLVSVVQFANAAFAIFNRLTSGPDSKHKLVLPLPPTGKAP